MAWQYGLACLSALAAFGCAFFVLHAAAAWRMRRRAATLPRTAEARGGWTAWLLRNGVAPLHPVSERIVRARIASKLFSDAAEVVAARGYVASPASLAEVSISVLAVVMAAVSVLSASPACGCAVAACVAALACAWLRSEQDKREAAVREAVPDALRSMGACFQSGYTLVQTLAHVGEEASGPLSSAFSGAARLLQTGGSVPEALALLRSRAAASELAFVSVALDVQHQAGGSMERVLASAREMVEGELELERSLRVQTAQAKLSARVVSVMPFVLIALFSLVSEDFLAPFFSSVMGFGLLLVAISMQVVGIFAVRRLLKVEG